MRSIAWAITAVQPVTVSRALASTCLNELGWKGEVIERQLAHTERNKVRAAYNRAQYLSERRQMMQAWADFVDAQQSKKVVR